MLASQSAVAGQSASILHRQHILPDWIQAGYWRSGWLAPMLASQSAGRPVKMASDLPRIRFTPIIRALCRWRSLKAKIS
jgi:hypothetical protein